MPRHPNPRPQEFAERFWSYVRKVDGDGCWEWTSKNGAKGYGRMPMRWQDGYTVEEGAHRIAWMLTRGDPGTLYVLHKCDNRKCVRPDHLFLGTQGDNVRDCVAKGRWRGPHGPAKPIQS